MATYHRSKYRERGEGRVTFNLSKDHTPATAAQQPEGDPRGVAGTISAELPEVATLDHQLIGPELATDPSFWHFTEVKSETEISLNQTWEKRRRLVYPLKNLTKIDFY